LRRSTILAREKEKIAYGSLDAARRWAAGDGRRGADLNGERPVTKRDRGVAAITNDDAIEVRGHGPPTQGTAVLRIAQPPAREDPRVRRFCR